MEVPQQGPAAKTPKEFSAWEFRGRVPLPYAPVDCVLELMVHSKENGRQKPTDVDRTSKESRL